MTPLKDFLIPIATSIAMLCAMVAVVFAIMSIAGCSSQTTQKVYMPVPTNCDYNLTVIDINTTDETATLRTATKIIYNEAKIREDIKAIPCLNVKEVRE